MRVTLFFVLAAVASGKGCFRDNERVASDHMRYQTTTDVASAEACQTLCQNHDGCNQFTYYEKSRQCWLPNQDGVYVADVRDHPISGPKNCVDEEVEVEAPAEVETPAVSEPKLPEANDHTPAAPPAAGALVGAGAGAFSRNGEGTHKESSSFGESLNSTPVASSLTSSSLSSLPKWAVLLLFCALALALCGALAMAMKKPKKKKTKRAKKTEEVPLAPVVETVVAPAVVAAPIQTYSVPYAQPQVVEYVQPQMVEYVQQPQMVEYVQQPQMVEYVQQPQIGSIVQGAPVVSYVQ